MKRIKRFLILIALLAIFAGSFFFVSYRAENSFGRAAEKQTIIVEKGDSVDVVADKLKEKKLISKSAYFIYYAWTRNFEKRIMAGEYEIAPKLKIPEIMRILTEGKTKPGHITILFKEGWTAEDMAKKLNENELPGDEFLSLAMNPPAQMVSQFQFLEKNPKGSSLEGFLFPDTYFISPEESASNIVLRMLRNFDSKLTSDMEDAIAKQEKNIFDIITMASIVESEVRTEKDRKIVSGIFWNRIGIGMALQSDATVAYALGGEKKIQHNASDIAIDSPYNSYKFKGLPPGPVSNPGLSSIDAAINPTLTDYIYFLNNPKTGETFFAVTFEEHLKNKAANGL